MTDDELRAIIAERLARWTERLVSSHATPMVLVGIGHDANSGTVVVCALEDGAFSETRHLRALLRYAIDHLPNA